MYIKVIHDANISFSNKFYPRHINNSCKIFRIIHTRYIQIWILTLCEIIICNFYFPCGLWSMCYLIRYGTASNDIQTWLHHHLPILHKNTSANPSTSSCVWWFTVSCCHVSTSSNCFHYNVFLISTKHWKYHIYIYFCIERSTWKHRFVKNGFTSLWITAIVGEYWFR